MKKIALFLVSLVLLTSLYPAVALADDIGDGIEPMAISSPSVSISASGSSVTYKGAASYTTGEPSIRLTLTLQEKRNGVWYSIDSGSKTVTNAYSITYSRTETVTGGYYYRTKGVFTATNSGTTTIYSSQKWIS
jgi:hypothetical protein